MRAILLAALLLALTPRPPADPQLIRQLEAIYDRCRQAAISSDFRAYQQCRTEAVNLELRRKSAASLRLFMRQEAARMPDRSSTKLVGSSRGGIRATLTFSGPGWTLDTTFQEEQGKWKLLDYKVTTAPARN